MKTYFNVRSALLIIFVMALMQGFSQKSRHEGPIQYRSPEGLYTVQMGLTSTALYVDAVNGSDLNTGTAGDPFATIQKAIDVSVAGGTIYVAAGTYVEKPFVNKALTLQGAGYASTIIDASGISGEGTVVTISITSGDVLFDGFKMKNSPDQYIMTASSTSSSSVITVSNNYFDGDGTGGDNDFGFIAGYGNPAKIVLTYNTFDNTYNNCVLMEKQVGETEISHNYFTGEFPTVFFGTYGGLDITSHQQVNNNTFEMTDADPTWYCAAISFRGGWVAPYLGKYTNIAITDNIIQNLPWTSYNEHKGIYLLNTDPAGTGGEITGAVISGNQMTGYAGNNSLGIKLYGKISGTVITNNTLTGLSLGLLGIAYGSQIPQATTFSPGNTISGNTNGVIWPNTSPVLNAENNYWGTVVASGVDALISENVDADPWCDATFTTCTYHFPFTNDDTGLGYTTLQAALDAATDGQEVTVNIPGSYGGIVFNTGESVTLTNSSGGTVTFTGASPALTVASGTLTVSGMSYITATDDPTILVTGGTLNISECTITESTGFDRSGIYVSGTGVVNAGTVGIHGKNKFVTGAGGMAITNTIAGYVNAIGNYWGSTDYFDVSSKISGNVYFDPFCNSTFSVCTYSTSGGPITKAGKVVDLTGPVTVPVFVNNFNDVDAISLKLLFDGNILSFNSITPNLVLTGMTAHVYADPESDGPDTLTLGFFGGAPVDLEPPDTCSLFIHFDRLLPGTSKLTWDDHIPNFCEYQNYNIQWPYNDIPYDTYYKNGFVTDMSLVFTRDYALNTITAVVSGGTGAYLYDWNGPAPFTGDGTNTITPTLYSYGNYTVTVTDGLGAVLTGTYYYGPVHNIDIDVDYATIQLGIDGASSSVTQTLVADPGTYKENPVVNKSVVIKGNNADKDGRIARPNPESFVVTNGSQYGVFTIMASGVAINGFTIDGDDPLVTGLPVFCGEDANVYFCVNVPASQDNLTISNNILKHAAIGFYSDAGSSYVVGENNLITKNLFDAIGVFDYGYGVTLRRNFYCNIVDNKMTRVYCGVHINDFYGADGPVTWLLTGNEIHSYAAGTWYQQQYNQATPLTIDNNDFYAEASLPVTNNYGLLVNTMQNAVHPVITNNTISGTNYGLVLWNNTTSDPIALDNTNIITGTTIAGILMTNNLSFNPVGTTSFGEGGASTVILKGIQVSPASGIGVEIDASATTVPTTQTLSITDPTVITGGTTGLLINGSSTAIAGNSINNLSFSGQTGNYITLSNNALYNQQITATNSFFDGLKGSTADNAQNFAIEDKILHKLDNASLGLIRVKADELFVTQNSNSIQRGIDAADPLDIIWVNSGIFNESPVINKDLDIRGFYYDNPRCIRQLDESTIGGYIPTVTIASDGVSLNGFYMGGYCGIYDDSYEGLELSNNVIDAWSYGIYVSNLSLDGSNGLTLDNNCITLLSRVFWDKQTVGIFLGGITGTAAAVITDNTIKNSFYGYMAYNVGTSSARPTISGGTITGVMQGVAIVNMDPNDLTLPYTYGPSYVNLENINLSGFAGDYSTLPDFNFHAGVYVFTGGNTANTGISATVDNVSVTGTGSIASDCAGMSFVDFSTESTAGQDITVSGCSIRSNKNRGINVRGNNALVHVNTSILHNNGYDSYNASNNGFGISSTIGATVYVDNCFITNPSTSTYSVNALSTFDYGSGGGTIIAEENCLNRSGNGWLANNGGGTMTTTCNWWGTNTVTGVPATMTGLPITYDPWLVFAADNDADSTNGFQPVPNSCYGMEDVYVNDGFTAGDFYTLTTGVDDNAYLRGTAATPYASISYGVTRAMVESNIWVDAGTYQEQVQIGKTLNVTGVDSLKTIVKAPLSLNPPYIIHASGLGNTIGISKLQVSGDSGRNPINEVFYGVYFDEAGGSLERCWITGIRSPILSNYQYINAVTVSHEYDTPVDQTVVINLNRIDDYGKAGIVVAEWNTYTSITNNIIIGQNIPNVVCQNGVQIGYGAYGTITGNTITNNLWNEAGPVHEYMASGILINGVGVNNLGNSTSKVTTIGGNTLSGNEAALYTGFAEYGYSPNYNLVLDPNIFSNNKIHVMITYPNATPNVSDTYDKRVDNPEQTNTVFGCIQYAIDEADPLSVVPDQLIASKGTFIEKVTVHTPVDLRGPNYGTCGSASRVDEAIVIPPDNDPDYVLSLVNVEVSNVSIDGFKFEGDNPDISGGTPVGGIDVNVCTAIANAPDVDAGPFAQINHLSIRNNILQDFVWPGIYLKCDYGNDQSFNYITCNKFDNMWEGIQNYATQTSITDNTFDNLDRAVSYHQVSTSGDGFLPEISDNIIKIDWRSDWDENSAIWINGRITPAPALVLDNNSITCEVIPGGKNFRAIQVLNVQDTRQLSMTNNTVNGAGLCKIGLKIMNSASPNISFANGHLLDIKDIGVLAENYYTNAGNPEWNGPGVVNLTLDNTEITMAIAGTGTGVMASAVTGFTQPATVNVVNNCDISNGAIGILANGIGAKANINNNTTTISGNVVGIKIDNGAELTSCTYNTITNNTQAGILIESDAGTIGAIENNTISGNGNMTLPNHGIGLQNDKAAFVDASPNWWGHETGPYNTPLNLCGQGNAVIGNVTFSPWFYQAAMSSLNGVPSLTLSMLPNVYSVTKTPIIVNFPVSYPNLTGYDPSILTDAVISTTAATFPAGTKVIEVIYDDNVNPPVVIPVSFVLSTGNSFYLSDILGNPSPYGTPLVNHSLMSIDWTFTIEGATSPVTDLPISIQPVSYLSRAACNNTLGIPATFEVTFADATLALTTAPDPVCYPAGEAALDFLLTHPAINPVSHIIRSNAIIVSDKQLPVGTTIEWTYNPGGVDETSGTFISTIATTTLYLSEIVTNTQGNLLSPNLFGHTGPLSWDFTISNLLPGTYNFDIQAAAQLLDGTLYPYATMAPPLQIIFAGATSVNVLPITSISTVTKTPVIIPVTVTYPDLVAQAISPTVLTDARLTTTTGNFPAGARIFKVTYEGAEVVPFTPYVFGSSQNEVFLSDILGAATPLLNHSELTIDWEFFIDGVLSPVIIPIKVEAIAYVNKAVCYSVMDTETFSVTFADAVQDLTGTYTVCATDPLVVISTTDFPAINVDSRVKSDALITSDNDFNANAEIAIYYNGTLYETYTVPAGGKSSLYVSEMLGSGPNPLNTESGELDEEWKFSITGLDDGVYNLTVNPVARLETGVATYSDYAYDTDNATLTRLNCGLSGKVTYNNVANTKMNNVDVALYQGGVKKYPLSGSVTTDPDGNYAFSALASGTYEVRLTTSKSTYGSSNVTDAAQVNHWQSSPYPIEKVRFFAGDVAGGGSGDPNNYLTAYDAQRIQAKFVQGSAFDRVPWSFWRAGEQIASHPLSEFDGYIYPEITIATGSPSQTGINFYMLATGDPNRSFTPGGAKSGTEHMSLAYSGDLQVNASSDFVLPVYIVQDITAGAASIILNYPDEFVEVTNVEMNYGGLLDWSAKNGELRIGWMTQSPVSFAANEEMFRLSLKTTAAFTEGNEIRIELADNILNEMADPFCEPIPMTRLAIAVASASAYGTDDNLPGTYKISLSNYPNPFRDYTEISYALPFAGRVTLTVYDLLGSEVATLADADQTSGAYTVEYLTGTLKPGVYTVALKLQSNGQSLMRTVKMVKMR